MSPRGYQTKAGIITLLGHLNQYAHEIDVISKMYSKVITVRDLDVPESNRELLLHRSGRNCGTVSRIRVSRSC